MADLGSLPWIEALGRSVSGADPGGVVVTVLHRVAGGPSWVVASDGRRVEVRAATEGEEGDVSFTWQPDDAAAVAAGTATVLGVFGTGRLRVGGDLRRLAEATALFAGLPGVSP